MFKNFKSVGIALIVVAIIVIAGFVLLMTRKQSVTLNGETAYLKSSWKKPADAPADEKPAAK